SPLLPQRSCKIPIELWQPVVQLEPRLLARDVEVEIRLHPRCVIQATRLHTDVIRFHVKLGEHYRTACAAEISMHRFSRVTRTSVTTGLPGQLDRQPGNKELGDERRTAFLLAIETMTKIRID